MNFARTITAFLSLSFSMLIFAQKAEMNSTRSAPQNSQTLRVDVDLVLIHATVTDSDNQYVTGLKAEHFQVWEDKIQQEIKYFSTEDVPLSVGIIFDVSGSMQNVMPIARNAAVTFLRMGSPSDEYFLVQFSDAARLAQDFTRDIRELQQQIAFNSAKGRTALYDALYLGLNQVSRGMNSKKALLLITDGQDNHSRYSFANVKEFAREHDVQVYAIGIVDPTTQGGSGFSGSAPLNTLASMTGGRTFFPESVLQLQEICMRIGLELKNQYLLGYKSSNEARDGKWRNVKLKIDRQKGMPRMNVRAKAGYHAPTLARAMK